MEGSSFFDEYEDLGGGNWISSEEKAVMIENGIPFDVLSVVEDPAGKYGARFVLKVLCPDSTTGEMTERQIGFAQNSVESRDRMLHQMKEYLAREDAKPVSVKIERVGRSDILRQA